MSNPSFGNCAIEGGIAGIANTGGATVNDGGNNIDSDPLFVNAADADGADGAWMTSDDGLALGASSPYIDAGTATGAPATDITGATRPQGSGHDLGAYEN